MPRTAPGGMADAATRPHGAGHRGGGARAAPESLTDRAYRELEEQIVTLRLAPGAELSEAILGARLGIGRTPVREALQRLARESLVAILPRRGVLVSEVDPRKQLLVVEVRRELERLMSRTGAERATGGERERFREIAEGMEAAARGRDDIGFMRHDGALNALVAEAAHNEYARRAMGLTHGLSRRFWYIHFREAADLPLMARLHARQARAIADGGPEAAADASDRLIDYVEGFTRAAA